VRKRQERTSRMRIILATRRIRRWLNRRLVSRRRYLSAVKLQRWLRPAISRALGRARERRNQNAAAKKIRVFFESIVASRAQSLREKHEMTRAAKIVQAFVRSRSLQKRLRTLRESTVVVQSFIRRFLCLRRMHHFRCALLLVQLQFRAKRRDIETKSNYESAGRSGSLPRPDCSRECRNRRRAKRRSRSKDGTGVQDGSKRRSDVSPQLVSLPVHPRNIQQQREEKARRSLRTYVLPPVKARHHDQTETTAHVNFDWIRSSSPKVKALRAMSRPPLGPLRLTRRESGGMAYRRKGVS